MAAYNHFYLPIIMTTASLEDRLKSLLMKRAQNVLGWRQSVQVFDLRIIPYF